MDASSIGRRGPADDSNDNWGREPDELADTTLSTPKRLARRAAGSQKVRIAGALIASGVAGAAMLGPISTLAASPAPPLPRHRRPAPPAAARPAGPHHPEPLLLARATGIRAAGVVTAATTRP